MTDKKTTPTELSGETETLLGRARDKSIRLLAAIEKLDLPASLLRTIREGYEVPKEVADLFRKEFEDKDVDDIKPADHSFDLLDTNAEPWTESTIHPEEQTQEVSVPETEAKAADEKKAASPEVPPKDATATLPAQGENTDAKTEAPAKADAKTDSK